MVADYGTIGVTLHDIRRRLAVYGVMSVTDTDFEKLSYEIAAACHEIESQLDWAEKEVKAMTKGKMKAESYDMLINCYKHFNSVQKRIGDIDAMRDDESVEYLKKNGRRTASDYINEMSRTTSSAPPDAAFA